MARTVYVEIDRCIGCGACEDVCPGVFRVDRTLRCARVINQEGAPEEDIWQAIAVCPVRCISWEEALD